MVFPLRSTFHGELWLTPRPTLIPCMRNTDVNCLILPLLSAELCNISPDLTRVLMRVEVLCGSAVSGWHHCTGVGAPNVLIIIGRRILSQSYGDNGLLFSASGKKRCTILIPKD
jgi:hypothetical protein